MKWLQRFVVSRETILASRWISPFAHRLAHPSLWHFNRRSVSRGVALGLVAGLMIPVGQIIVAAVLALSVRANIIVAASFTLVTNPLTFPAIYYAAYRVGSFLLGSDTGGELTEDQVMAMADDVVLVETSWRFGGFLLPLAIGLSVFAAVSSFAGFFLARFYWTARVRRRWRRRALVRAAR
ncbi:MAG: DUF2062 domain-containing protein [Alphaproteobacteria bacterium]|nr:MAG: DUF2062 domain-containing protein [Alphaproteobacteria bacterium]